MSRRPGGNRNPQAPPPRAETFTSSPDGCMPDRHSPGRRFPVVDDRDAVLLDRPSSGHATHGPDQEFDGDVQTEPPRPPGNAAWVQRQFAADPAMRSDYVLA